MCVLDGREGGGGDVIIDPKFGARQVLNCRQLTGCLFVCFLF